MPSMQKSPGRTGAFHDGQAGSAGGRLALFLQVWRPEKPMPAMPDANPSAEAKSEQKQSDVRRGWMPWISPEVQEACLGMGHAK